MGAVLPLYQHGYSMESIQKELKNVLDMVTENNKVEGEIFTNFECAAAFLSVRLNFISEK